ncbi:MAG: GerMN domain-containing protein, partial [Lachnospiraceae bacterium]|nr:GerMN domain-containing protein [Lachnospiraceae bacterium]
KYESKKEYNSATSKEQVIVNMLIEGPGEQEGYTRTVPANVEVVRVVTMDNVCYVTLGENFQTETTFVQDELVIYSIVNSLSELPYIHKVQISITGENGTKYHNKISLDEAFVRNLDYVEASEGLKE